MVDAIPFSKYSTAARYFTERPGWVPEAHKDRVASYQVYTEIYWSHVGALKVMNRGLDAGDDPVYVPSSRIMVDTIDRYTAPNLTFQLAPETGTPASQVTAQTAFTNLFARERFASQYAAGKLEGVMKGDWLWHVVGDTEKPQGSRLSLLVAKAENYYPVFEDETIEGGDPDKMVMVLLAELIMVGDEAQVRVQKYERMEDGLIYSSLTTWKTDEWYRWRYDDDEKAPVSVINPPAPLPAGITAFPVYHIPNTVESGEVFGSSDIRGLEVLQAALNQSVTDEDLALALMGLGLYATEEPGSPRDEQGNAVPWIVAPGSVLENAKGLHKVDGLSTLVPYTEHVERLDGYMGDASGATDAAKGRIQVAEAESGIALQLRLAPTLAKAAKKDKIIQDVHAQLFYDLVQMWFPAIEGLNFTDVLVLPVLGDKLPVNRVQEVSLVNELVIGGILSAASARTYLAGKGFTSMFSEDEGALVLAEKTANAAAEGGTGGLVDRAAQEGNGDGQGQNVL